MKRSLFLLLCVLALLVAGAQGQTINATLEGRVLDATGAALPNATVTAVSSAMGLTRSATTTGGGDYTIPGLPVGEYTVTAEHQGFKKDSRKVVLQIGQNAAVNFNLAVGQVEQQVNVEALGELVEPTRTSVSSVITEVQIDTLPVNGRQFIDFALLAPGVTVGETTSGSTDVIIEPVTKISFAGQNIHYNLVAIDGADNMSTASGIQKTTPSQEAVQEFRVINTQYSAEAGRAAGGIVNIITKSGTNDWHGSAYWFHRNDALDARSILTSPDLPTCNVPGDPSSGGCQFLDKLIQNQYGFTLGGPVKKDKLFIFGNYEGQRRRENPFYNSVIIDNFSIPGPLNDIQDAKANFGLPPEELRQTRTFDYDQFLVKVDSPLSERHYLFIRYFFNDASLLNQSPLNDGFDLPSGFKNNFFRDQSLVGSLTSTLRTNLLNELRVQYANRFFDFPTVSTQPHLEVANTFTVGVNRGNPDFYREPRFEISDSLTWTKGKHTLSWGGTYNHVTTEESFPLFYPFEATFGTFADFLAGNPFVIFFQRNDTASSFFEPSILPNGTAIYQGGAIPESIRNLAKGELAHDYWGFFVQDKWRATDRLTLNFGVRYEFETWPDGVLDTDSNNVDPRFGFAYNIGTSKNLVLRGGVGLFHGIEPSNLLHCQRGSCGGVRGEFPGREEKENELDAATRLFALASDPFVMQAALAALLQQGLYPDAATSGPGGLLTCPPNTPLATVFFTGCPNSFLADSVIVRFAKDHQAPYGIQMSLGVEFEPFKNTAFNASYLRVRGVQLSSFFNINQPPPSADPALDILFHDSQGNTGPKDRYYGVCFVPPACNPGTFIPGVANTGQLPFAVYFEADSRWSSTYDGLLVNFAKRATGHFGFGISYTWSKGIDNGPNPSFVLIPNDSADIGFRRERAISSDHIKHRFVGNATIIGPRKTNFLVNDWELGTIMSFQSPRYFTKFAGFDANGDVFGVNDRVGIEPRNTFQGDGYAAVDVRISRTFKLGERAKLQGIFEAFNLLNTLNVRFFNTVYGAGDFCPAGDANGFCPPPAQQFLEGSPNPNYGSPRAIFNPRQLQIALRLSF